MKTTAPLLALLLVGCAQVITEPQGEPLAAPAEDPELRELADAAVLLIERGKLLPLADALRALGPEPNPAEAAATIDRVLRGD